MGCLRGLGIEVDARPGVDLLSQLLDAGGDPPYLCMAGSCRTCRVQVLAGEEALEPREAAEAHLPLGQRLTCQARYRGPGTVDLALPPPTPRFSR